MDEDKPKHDPKRAEAILGKHVLIGLSYYDPDDVLLEHVQLHGDIQHVDEEQVIIRLRGSGEDFILPPDPSAFTDAPPGEYRLRSTGEVVIDPDLLTQWNIHRPRQPLSEP